MHHELAIPEADFLRRPLELELHLIVSSNSVLIAVRHMAVLRSTNIWVTLVSTGETTLRWIDTSVPCWCSDKMVDRGHDLWYFLLQ